MNAMKTINVTFAVILLLSACGAKDEPQDDLSKAVQQPPDKAGQVQDTVNQQAEQQREQIEQEERGAPPPP